MKNIVVGTAGHIDHGKTALVKALTGIDADRLEEEKRRGITIDLGFAHLELTPDLRLGFVDVPGHERFVKNMLAGVGGIDLVLFVVAADESIKPQTREHFDICRLLGIPRGIVALTKSRPGGPRHPRAGPARGGGAGRRLVSGGRAHRAGQFRHRRRPRRLARASWRERPLRCREKDAGGHFRLPIDRVFSIKGFGTVATGTLVSGSVAREQEVEVYPDARRLRVRGVQVHGSASERAVAGQRTAVNLADVEPSELTRGNVLSEPGRFHAVTHLDARLHLLASAKPLKHRAPVHFHAGTAEIEAEVRLLEERSAMPPGASAWVRIVLRDPALILPGDRFIIRMFSPVITIGGGVVADIGNRRYPRREDPGPRLSVLSSTDNAARIALLVREQPYGMSAADLVARTGLTAGEIASAAARAPLDTAGDWLVDRAWMQAARERITAGVREFHQKNPLLPGVPRQDLRGGAPQFVLDALLAQAKDLISDGDLVRARTHRVVLKEDEEQARGKIESTFERAGLAVPALSEVLAQSGVEPARARSILQILLRERRLVRVSDELVFHHAAVARLKESLTARKGQRFAVTDFKEWTGVSRKYAIPLLEFLDRERVTRREGDQRIVV